MKICRILLILLTVSCSPRSGWDKPDSRYYVDSDTAFHGARFYSGKLPKNDFLKDFILVGLNTFSAGEIQGRDSVTDLIIKRRVTVTSVYVQKYEVSVAEYMAFVKETSIANKPDTLSFMADCYADTNNCFFFNYPDHRHYFWHPKYWVYPVTGVNLHQVNAYIAWKTRKINDELSRKGFLVKLRLPTHYEMESFMSYYPTYHAVQVNKINLGPVKELNGYTLYFACEDNYCITAPVKSMEKNAVGLYHIKGNVAEWTCSKVNDIYQNLEWTSDSCIKHYAETYHKNVSIRCFNDYQVKLFKDSSMYMTKGGSWYDSPFQAQNAAFIPVRANENHSWLGFRMVMELYKKE